VSTTQIEECLPNQKSNVGIAINLRNSVFPSLP
jgi:hypothetical protein